MHLPTIHQLIGVEVFVARLIGDDDTFVLRSGVVSLPFTRLEMCLN